MRKKILSINVIFNIFFSVYTIGSSASATVKMRGSIIETACAIDVGSLDQTIDMGSLPLSTLHRDGQGPIRPFHIRLVNCVLARQDPAKPNWQYFRVTFDGSQSLGLFKISGQASGIGLQIQREDGEIAVPGKRLPRQSLSIGERDLSYQLRLIANHDVLMSGQYSSQLRFKLDYE